MPLTTPDGPFTGVQKWDEFAANVFTLTPADPQYAVVYVPKALNSYMNGEPVLPDALDTMLHEFSLNLHNLAAQHRISIDTTATGVDGGHTDVDAYTMTLSGDASAQTLLLVSPDDAADDDVVLVELQDNVGTWAVRMTAGSPSTAGSVRLALNAAKTSDDTAVIDVFHGSATSTLRVENSDGGQTADLSVEGDVGAATVTSAGDVTSTAGNVVADTLEFNTDPVRVHTMLADGLTDEVSSNSTFVTPERNELDNPPTVLPPPPVGSGAETIFVKLRIPLDHHIPAGTSLLELDRIDFTYRRENAATTCSVFFYHAPTDGSGAATTSQENAAVGAGFQTDTFQIDEALVTTEAYKAYASVGYNVDETATAPTGNEAGNPGWLVYVDSPASGDFTGEEGMIGEFQDPGWIFFARPALMSVSVVTIPAEARAL